MTLTFITHISSYIQLDVCSYYLSGHWLQSFLKNPLFSLSPIDKPVTKFDLAVKKVKVTRGSSFEQTMMGLSPQCYIQSFVEIDPPVPEKKIFEGFLPCRGVAAILVI